MDYLYVDDDIPQDLFALGELTLEQHIPSNFSDDRVNVIRLSDD
jgi:hypothetical protein